MLIDISSRFPFLSGAYHLAYYFPSSRGSQDQISRFILKFKDNEAFYVEKWSNIAAHALANANNLSVNIIIRALGSKETRAEGKSPLDRLAERISMAFSGSNYCPLALTKTRITRSLKFMNREQRENEINNVYIFSEKNLKNFVNGANILVIDDIVTDGATIKEIYRAIKKTKVECNLYLFTLAKTYDRKEDFCKNNNHLNEFFNSMSSGDHLPNYGEENDEEEVPF